MVLNSLPPAVARAVDDPSAGLSGLSTESPDVDFPFEEGLMWDELKPAIMSHALPDEANMDPDVNPGAAGAVIRPPPPTPCVVITEDNGQGWSRVPRTTLGDGIRHPNQSLEIQNRAAVYLGYERILESTGPESSLINQYPDSLAASASAWDVSLLDGQNFFNSEYTTPMHEPYHLSPTSISWEPLEQGSSSVMSSYDASSGMSRMSSSSGSSAWVVPTPASDDTSMASDGELEDTSAEITVQPSPESTTSLGPCSRAWLLPPRTRRKRKSKAENAPKKHHRKADGRRRRGPFKDDHTRLNTALTRKLRGCIRCRMMRIRCEPDQENLSSDCLTCQRAQSSKILGILQLPCLRLIITDVSLYREQDMPCQLFSKRWQSMDLVDITNWASTETKTISLSQVHIDAPYFVRVREFIPEEGDMLQSEWRSGSTVKHHRIPLYALADIESAAQILVQFTSHYVPQYISQTVGKLDLLLWQTYYFTFHHQEKAKKDREQRLIQNCLRLWVGCQKTSHPEHIYSTEKLGGSVVDDPESLFYNMVPMPPIMIAQMECIMYTKVLRPLSQQVLNDLKDLVMENKRENWLTIYLTLFLLLHSCSMLTRRDWETARQYGLQEEYANLKSIQAMQSGMLIILAHFHYLNRGILPFHLTYDDKGLNELAIAADLDDHQRDFVKFTSMLVNDSSRVAYMQEIRKNKEFGDDLYWVSQLYDHEWKPGPTA